MRKERGEPGKMYYVRNLTGREDLITCGRTNKICPRFIVAVLLLISCESFMADNGPCYITWQYASYGKRTQTLTFEKHANLLAYLTN